MDHVLVLPRTVAELPTKTCEQPGNKEARTISRQRFLKDIQSSLNVSEEVAESICLKYRSELNITQKRQEPHGTQKT
jgi:hypothetical protein